MFGLWFVCCSLKGCDADAVVCAGAKGDAEKTVPPDAGTSKAPATATGAKSPALASSAEVAFLDADGLPHYIIDGLKFSKLPSVNHEARGPQVLCRNGFVGSKSVAIKYGVEGSACATKAEALAMGSRWLEAEKASKAAAAGA